MPQILHLSKPRVDRNLVHYKSVSMQDQHTVPNKENKILLYNYTEAELKYKGYTGAERGKLKEI